MIPYERVVEGYRSVVPIIGPAKKFAEARKERYAPLTDGMKDPNRRLVLEFVLDTMIKEQFGPHVDLDDVRKALRSKTQTEGTTTGDIDTFVKHIYPIVTRTFWSMQLMNLISTQPLTAPTGRIFFQDIPVPYTHLRPHKTP